ncbi:MAG: hypothetical protein MPL62_02455 [Alphaproteobacteria bacterium]|nr:hypothetical protein [Alphaproteobacteria bacterium]
MKRSIHAVILVVSAALLYVVGGSLAHADNVTAPADGPGSQRTPAFAGSVSFDKPVYPVPFGGHDDASNFRYHDTFKDATGGKSNSDRYIRDGTVTVHIQISDKDLRVSRSGANGVTLETGMLDVKITRSSDSDTPASASSLGGKTMTETSAGSGIFEISLPIRYDDGPSKGCPTGGGAFGKGDGCILQGDVITVTYVDAADNTGNKNTVTDSAQFDLRNGVLQSDKSVYSTGSDMVLILEDPDLDLDGKTRESYSLDIIEWDSDADTTTMGPGGGEHAAFSARPGMLEETGVDTGIFQSIIKIPVELDGKKLGKGELITLEYTDWGPAAADYVGDEDEDIRLDIATTNYGASVILAEPKIPGHSSVSLDKHVYTWTDKVLITIIAPDYNRDGSAVESIGRGDDHLMIATREGKLSDYTLLETGPDTGIFSGSVTLTGFDYDIDGVRVESKGPAGGGPTNGLLPANNEDGITVYYEHSDDETFIGKALIRWKIGDIQWLSPSYPADGTGTVRVTDPDMNIDPEAVDRFEIGVSSDTVIGGISLTVTETSKSSGIFEGSVSFTSTGAPSGSRLRVTAGDTVTAEYDDTTLPDPYKRGDETTISSSTFIERELEDEFGLSGGRIEISNVRISDSGGGELPMAKPGEMVRLHATFENSGEGYQQFTYMAEIQKGQYSEKKFLTTQLAPKTSADSAISWTPPEQGTYEISIHARPSVESTEDLTTPVYISVETEGQKPSSKKPSIGDQARGLKKMSVDNPTIMDGVVKLGQKIDIFNKVTNNQNTDQEYVHIVKITDMEGVSVHISWSEEVVSAKGHRIQSASWTPVTEGRYVVTILAWTSMENPVPLAYPGKATIVVE